ncbi:hypothetical protein EVAR_17351_1 [Eumeta japonica]|uniref:Uncharacterized protein n=1 Tax=Eumeta variegata TaxID=151549 RepID=A0A4C1WGW9_EUMVA|nr:hypothetical protein EVAR_17351_1 [Eumeta japonica]
MLDIGCGLEAGIDDEVPQPRGDGPALNTLSVDYPNTDQPNDRLSELARVTLHCLRYGVHALFSTCLLYWTNTYPKLPDKFRVRSPEPTPSPAHPAHNTNPPQSEEEVIYF